MGGGGYSKGRNESSNISALSCHEFKLKFTAAFLCILRKISSYFCFSQKRISTALLLYPNFCRAVLVKSLILDPAQGKIYRD
jgi:hypothetical protein